MNQTEKYRVRSGIRYVSWNQVRVGFSRCGFAKLIAIFSFVWGNMQIGSQAIDRAAIFWIRSTQTLCAHKENGTLNIYNEQLTLISGPWHSIGSGLPGRVSQVGFCTCITWRVRVGCSFHSWSLLWGNRESMPYQESKGLWSQLFLLKDIYDVSLF